jgi:hypothetical protein
MVGNVVPLQGERERPSLALTRQPRGVQSGLGSDHGTDPERSPLARLCGGGGGVWELPARSCRYGDGAGTQKTRPSRRLTRAPGHRLLQMVGGSGGGLSLWDSL